MTANWRDQIAVDAARILRQIENRTAYIAAQAQFAVGVLLNIPVKPGTALDIGKLSAHHLETWANQWAHLVPDNAYARAALAQGMARKYRLIKSEIPNIRRALKLDDDLFREVFLRLHSQSIDTLYQETNDGGSLERFSTIGRRLEEVLRDDLSSELEWVLLPRGETLFRQGEPGDGLYIIISGLLRVTTAESAEDSPLIELRRGDIVGEMSIVTGEPRSATVFAVRDTQLCKFSRDGFNRLAAQYQTVVLQVALQLINRLRRYNIAERTFTRPTTLAVVPITDGVPLHELSVRLAALLERYGETLHLNRAEVTQRFLSADGTYDDYEFVAWLNQQEAQRSAILYEADRGDDGWLRRCLQQADRLLLVARAGEPPRPFPDDIQQMMQGRRAELVLLHQSGTARFEGTQRWQREWPAQRHHHVDLQLDGDLERVVRFLRGQAVGLVLGGGGMRGAAHVGVLRALAEAGIQIDAVGGTSIGAVVAALHALGCNYEQMLQIAREKLFSRSAILDYTLPLVSLAAAQRVTRGYRDIFGDVMIEDLRTPFFCISTNLSKAKMMVHQSGLLRKYLRASTSLPGVYPPVLSDEGDLLIDGAVFNNLPADIMRTFSEGGRVIAVDIGAGMGKESGYRFDDSVSGWRLLRQRLTQSEAALKAPSLMTVVLRTVTIANASTRTAQLAGASLIIRPPVEQYGLFEMNALTEMYEVGYRSALDALAAWGA